MKIELVDSPKCPVPQFIVTAETDLERLMLKAFLTFRGYTNTEDDWIFSLKCQGSSMDTTGWDSFTFGWSKK